MRIDLDWDDDRCNRLKYVVCESSSDADASNCLKCETPKSFSNYTCPAKLSNAKFNGPSYQDNEAAWGPHLAIDGIVRPSIGIGVLAHSEHWKDVTFSVEIDHPCKIKQIKIYPRSDGNHDRYSDMKAYLRGDFSTDFECGAIYDWSDDANYVWKSTTSGLMYDCNYDGLSEGIFVHSENNFVQIVEIEAECVDF